MFLVHLSPFNNINFVWILTSLGVSILVLETLFGNNLTRALTSTNTKAKNAKITSESLLCLTAYLPKVPTKVFGKWIYLIFCLVK